MPKPDSERRVIRVALSQTMYDALLRAAENGGVPYAEIVRRGTARELGDLSLAEMAPAHRPRQKDKAG